ncbi:aminoglycoside phosphotransferase family protein [Myceligenerans salitolerans]|uniref:Aminoglycoside phosphotransferase family protein n=1 Tax=Myceligenerans salitolerans TaxID=1230528 RepID=A0ABS3I7K9_9MICO|nr:aminoglycoside phosphotransferase family protein [Myceligenerans salitolerans]MBO0608989.1 aminoglycoside phosphotransferase family protein [Myceligenerans salitolerans]
MKRTPATQPAGRHEPDTVDSIASVAHQAAVQVGIDNVGARPLRHGSNALYFLPSANLVARVGRPGSFAIARREVRAAAWLAGQSLRVNTPAPEIEQPILVGDRPVTWWLPLPRHRHATTAELATVLRRMHELPVPAELGLPTFNPLAHIADRIGDAPGITQGDRSWLLDRAAELRQEAAAGALPASTAIVHGDAWQGNVVVPDDGEPVLLDFEHVALGHPDWDLIPIAVDHTDFARLSDAEYDAFVGAYGGHDVTTTPWFRTMADIQELRWTAFIAQKAATDSRAATEAAHRIACLRGAIPKPWTWAAF